MQPLPSWISPLTLQIAPNLKKSPSTERQRRHNPHENEYRQHFQQQGDGAGVPCVANPEKGQYAKHDKESNQHRTSPVQIYIP